MLLLIAAIGAYAYYRQLRYGLIVTNMRDYVSWGIYISNFVFFVAISLVGSLITAILRLANVHWATPLTRIAEIIAVSVGPRYGTVGSDWGISRTMAQIQADSLVTFYCPAWLFPFRRD